MCFAAEAHSHQITWQAGSVLLSWPQSLKEGLVQLSVVVGRLGPRQAPSRPLEAKLQEFPGSAGSDLLEALATSCSRERLVGTPQRR